MGVRNTISHTSAVMSGLVLGAAAMYILDPQQGNRRRTLARDKALRGGHQLLSFARRRTRDAANRLYGLGAELVSTVRDRVSAPDDDALVRRVRAQLGHVVQHPSALEVRAANGIVTIFGPVLSSDVQPMEERLRKTRGVRDCILRVDRHDSPAGVPGLQGEPHRTRRSA